MNPLVRWRKAHGLSQAALVAKLRELRLAVTVRTITRWETGKSKTPQWLWLALERVEK